jgi:NAD(P)-dependent dehydrogenase (short-subunit alcohol dehydrogenase family)
MGRLEGKVALITGAGAGIAKATAKQFVKEGAKVAIFELNRETGAKAEEEIRAAGGEATFIETDFTKDESVKNSVAAAVKKYGKLDVIMNCTGGSYQDDVPVHEMELEVWHRTMALNLLHPFLMCRYGIPHLMKAGKGSIINFSSNFAVIGSIKPAYAAAKGGVISFTKTLASQYADIGIRANAIAPSTVRTERSIKRWENEDWMQNKNPSPTVKAAIMVRKLYPFSVGEPDDIAHLAVFLASDESRMITGVTITADGGRSSYQRVSPE